MLDKILELNLEYEANQYSKDFFSKIDDQSSNMKSKMEWYCIF